MRIKQNQKARVFDPKTAKNTWYVFFFSLNEAIEVRLDSNVKLKIFEKE